MRRTPLIPAAVAAASLLATAFASPANAADGEVVADGLASVLSVAVAEDGTVYATQNFPGLLTRIAPGGEPEVIYADEGHREIGGVSVSGDVVTFTATSQGGPANARVYTYSPAEGGGFDQTEIADTWAFEKANNPDGKTTYGIAGLSKSCKKDIPKDIRPFVTAYKGIKESHPYATTTAGDVTYVADAAGNAILAVEGGEVSKVAVLPPVKVKVTKPFRKNMGLPKCTQGKTFKGEPVPTDVEVGPDGNLYVTTLGGALGESMPVGAVYQVTPAGAVSAMATDLMTPTGIAIGADGTSYISMLFAGTVLAVPFGGAPGTFAELPFPGDVEVQGGSVYITRTGLTDPEEGPYTGAVLKYAAPVG